MSDEPTVEHQRRGQTSRPGRGAAHAVEVRVPIPGARLYAGPERGQLAGVAAAQSGSVTRDERKVAPLAESPADTSPSATHPITGGRGALEIEPSHLGAALP